LYIDRSLCCTCVYILDLGSHIVIQLLFQDDHLVGGATSSTYAMTARF
jgi:hypothetical protein